MLLEQGFEKIAYMYMQRDDQRVIRGGDKTREYIYRGKRVPWSGPSRARGAIPSLEKKYTRSSGADECLHEALSGSSVSRCF